MSVKEMAALASKKCDSWTVPEGLVPVWMFLVHRVDFFWNTYQD